LLAPLPLLHAKSATTVAAANQRPERFIGRLLLLAGHARGLLGSLAASSRAPHAVEDLAAHLVPGLGAVASVIVDCAVSYRPPIAAPHCMADGAGGVDDGGVRRPDSDVKGTSQNARFARSDGLEFPPAGLSSRVIDLCARTDVTCEREIDRRSTSDDHSSPSPSLRSTKTANRSRARRVRMRSERALQTEEAVRSLALRVFPTKKANSSPENARSPPEKVVYRAARTSTERTSSSTDRSTSSTHVTTSSIYATRSSNAPTGSFIDPTSEAA
jgi:hypothetical protein